MELKQPKQFIKNPLLVCSLAYIFDQSLLDFVLLQMRKGKISIPTDKTTKIFTVCMCLWLDFVLLQTLHAEDIVRDASQDIVCND